MKLDRLAGQELQPMEFEKVSVEDAKKALEGRPQYQKNWGRDRLPGAQPVLLEKTRAWLREIPEASRPLELAQRYPRIANDLARLWPTPARCERYISDLLILRRGGSIRQGFPVAVARELTALSSFYTALHPVAPVALEWKQ